MVATMKRAGMVVGAVLFAISFLSVSYTVQADPLEARAYGGGIIGGEAGLSFGSSTSQFGFVALLDVSGMVKGHFNCLMAGFSGGFSIPETPFQEVLLMQVSGTIDTVSVEAVAGHDIHGIVVDGIIATITGQSKVTIVGKTAEGKVIKVTMDLPYVLEILAGGPGAGILHLDHPDLGLHTGGLLEKGSIVVD